MSFFQTIVTAHLKLRPYLQTIKGAHYSHLSNKCEFTLTDFEKFHPPQKKNLPSTFIDFLDFFQPSTPRYVIVFSKKSHPPHFFQPPRLVIWHFCTPSTFIPTSTFIREMRVGRIGNVMHKTIFKTFVITPNKVNIPPYESR